MNGGKKNNFKMLFYAQLLKILNIKKKTSEQRINKQIWKDEEEVQGWKNVKEKGEEEETTLWIMDVVS